MLLGWDRNHRGINLSFQRLGITERLNSVLPTCLGGPVRIGIDYGHQLGSIHLMNDPEMILPETARANHRHSNRFQALSSLASPTIAIPASSARAIINS